MAYLTDSDEQLEAEIIAVLLAGLKTANIHAAYPESHSDLGAAVRNLIRMYEVTRRTAPYHIRHRCHRCKGLGEYRMWSNSFTLETKECTECNQKGYIEEKI